MDSQPLSSLPRKRKADAMESSSDAFPESHTYSSLNNLHVPGSSIASSARGIAGISLSEQYEISVGSAPSTGRSLRKSTIDKTKAVKPFVRKKNLSTQQSVAALQAGTKTSTVRIEVRKAIAEKTAVKRANFLIAHSEVFLPLLPSRNHIQALIEDYREQYPFGKPVIAKYETVSQPKGVTAQLKPYQLSGLSFLVFLHKNGLSGILGDEMGLGKTLQTLSLFEYLKEQQGTASTLENRPFLVICPLSVLEPWIKEAKKWTPKLKVLRFHGSPPERAALKQLATLPPVIDLDNDDAQGDGRPIDLIVTTYETFNFEKAWFSRAFVWRYVVLDEGHRIKRQNTQSARALQGLTSEYRLIITGTPLQNDLKELWGLLHWLYPDVFINNTEKLFQSAFNLSKGQVDTGFMDKARDLLELIMIRRMKDSQNVNLDIPPKSEVQLFIPLTPLQRAWYKTLLTRTDQALLEEIFQDPKSQPEGPQSLGLSSQTASAKDKEKSMWLKLQNLLVQLQKVCNHPYIVPGAVPESYTTGEHLIYASSKFIVLEKLLSKLVVEQKKKVLIFSTSTEMLDSCEELLMLRGAGSGEFKYLRLDGNTCRARRNLTIRLFSDEESEHRVMLMTLRAGGLGINLVSASAVVLLDQDWNPQIVLQAESRAHRIGQNKPITIYKFCTQGTVEEQMMGRIQKKLYLSAKITESMHDVYSAEDKTTESIRNEEGSNKEAQRLSVTELMSFVRGGTRALESEINIEELLSWDWQTVLERCKSQSSSKALPENSEEDERQWLSTIEHVKSRVFEGKHYSLRDSEPASTETDTTTPRIRRSRTVVIDGFSVSTDSLACRDGEAVPTFGRKSPQITEAKSNKENIVNVAMTEGSSYSAICAPVPFTMIVSARSYKFGKGAAAAGGMIFRCRWCEAGFCEDCVDWENTMLIDDNVPELQALGYEASQHWYLIKCSRCKDHHEKNPDHLKMCEAMQTQFETSGRLINSGSSARSPILLDDDANEGNNDEEQNGQDGDVIILEVKKKLV
ncbi:MAG: hypothetical protein M1834_005261 [Cirrosporium novae-zelandiae]|nr:MAG: hypothetical protein M1834_005261 [Cirrosporium novae-zelandiae]